MIYRAYIVNNPDDPVSEENQDSRIIFAETIAFKADEQLTKTQMCTRKFGGFLDLEVTNYDEILFDRAGGLVTYPKNHDKTQQAIVFSTSHLKTDFETVAKLIELKGNPKIELPAQNDIKTEGYTDPILHTYFGIIEIK